jgi:hypothetical protein
MHYFHDRGVADRQRAEALMVRLSDLDAELSTKWVRSRDGAPSNPFSGVSAVAGNDATADGLSSEMLASLKVCRCAVLCCAVLCCAVLCCAVLCCAVLCCAVLCCVVH